MIEVSALDVLQPGRRDGTGNRILICHTDAGDDILKIYRPRRSRLRELARRFSSRFLEGRTGAGTQARLETERRSLTLWAEAGFAVPAEIDRPLPASVEYPAMWMTRCRGRLLSEVLVDDSVRLDRRLELIESLGRNVGERHALAMAHGEPLLVHEHPSPNHVFVDGDELVTIDFENGYGRRFPILEAVAQEISSHLRRLVRLDIPLDAHEIVSAFIRGYGDDDLLDRAVDHALYNRGIVRRLKRLSDRKRRPTQGKTALMSTLRDVLGR